MSDKISLLFGLLVGIFRDQWVLVFSLVFGSLFVVIGMVALATLRQRKKNTRLSSVSTPDSPAVLIDRGPSLEASVALPKGQPTVLDGWGLSATKLFLQGAFDKVFRAGSSEAFFDELEELLITADFGVDLTDKLMAAIRSEFGVVLPVASELRNRTRECLVRTMHDLLPQDRAFVFSATDSLPKPRVILIVGVNGAGKTTTIAKLLHLVTTHGRKAFVGAADTFRAAAVEQLKSWCDRLNVDGNFPPEQSDPASVAFETVQRGRSLGVDDIVIDTAGRLQNKTNLMEELKKVKRVIQKADPTAPHEVLLVVDGSTGQNATFQAAEFNSFLDITGIIVTKLDGSAKGGSALAAAVAINKPIIFIGLGESLEDIKSFKKSEFLNDLFSQL